MVAFRRHASVLPASPRLDSYLHGYPYVVLSTERRGETVTHTGQMLETTPAQVQFDAATLTRCIDACFDCAQACTACADACLGEDEVKELTRCIRLNLDCADICETTGRALSRQVGADPEVTRRLLEACAQACRSCGDECQRHAEGMNMAHCRVCAEACRACEQACNELLGTAA
jgi:hypothetical protein